MQTGEESEDRRASAGFTLLEMVLVLAIVGILAAIVTPSVMSAFTRAREATLQQDLKIMRKLIDDYYGDKVSSIRLRLKRSSSRAISGRSHPIRSMAVRRNGGPRSLRKAAFPTCAHWRLAAD